MKKTVAKKTKKSAVRSTPHKVVNHSHQSHHGDHSRLVVMFLVAAFLFLVYSLMYMQM